MRIVYIQYTNPAGYPPLEHSSRILAEAGWKVLFLGTGALGASRLDLPHHPNIQVRRLPFQPPGWRQKLHFVNFHAWVLLRMLMWKPQWIYASDLLACPSAWILSWLSWVKVLYHEHDHPHAGDADRRSLFLKVVHRTRRALLRRVAFSIVPNAARGVLLQRDTPTPRPVLPIWNCPSRQEAVHPAAPPDGQELILFYHGSVVPDRLPVTVLEAMSRLPPHVHLHFAGYETTGHRGYIHDLLGWASRFGLEGRVRHLGVLQRDELLQRCRQAHAGLALMPMRGGDPNMRTMVGASNKPFEYLACGLPLLVSDLPEWKDSFVAAGCALSCNPDDVESLCRNLAWLLEHPAERHALGETGRQRILKDWNYEAQFEPVAKLLSGQH